MSKEIDQRIVEMQFDNQEFERRIATTTKSLDRLKESLNLDDEAENFDRIQNSVSRLDFSGIADIGALALAKFKLISDAIDTVISKTKQFVKSVTIDPVNQGWTKYADITTATQTIMAATAKDFENEADQIKTVNEQLEKLNWFTDETSYNLTDMTNNIGKFTSSGVKLETAVTAMQGIGTWASVSGQGVTEASRAMYNLSQALGTGSVLVRDWMSIENANMATVEFKQNVIDTAVEMGTLTKVGEGMYKTLEGHEVTVATFREELKDKWFTSEVLLKTLDRYGGFTNKLNEYYNETGLLTSEILDYVNDYSKGTLDLEKTAKKAGIPVEQLTEMVKELSKAEYDLGRKSFAAAQEAKTFSEAIAATQDAVSTGWMKSFQLVFGDYKEAKKVWTALANELYDVFAEPGNYRNEILEAWSGMIDEVTGLTGRQLWFGDFEEQSGIIGNIWENVKAIFGAVNDGFKTVFSIFDEAEDVGAALFNFSKWLHTLTSDLVLTDDQVESISDAVAGLLKPVKTLMDLVVSIFKPTARFVGNTAVYIVKTLFPAVSGLVSTVGKLFGFLNKGKAFGGLSDKLETLYTALFRVSKLITNTIAKFIEIPTNAIEKGIKAYNAWIRATSSFGEAVFVGVKAAFNGLIRGIGKTLSEITGIDWFNNFATKIIVGINTISNKIKKLLGDIKDVYRIGGEGFQGIVHALLYTAGQAFTKITGWLSKVTGIKWFDNLEKNALSNIAKMRTAFLDFADKTLKVYNHFGGGMTGFLHALFYDTGKVARSAFDKLADLTGIEWFRTVGNKIFDFLQKLRDHIADFVDAASTILEPVKNTAKSIFSFLFGKEEVHDPTAELADSVEENTARMEVAYKSVAQMALEVIRGDWGNGIDRDNALWGAGYDNDRIQEVVNSIWTLTGEFKDGYEEILKEYENVDARMDGYVLPIDPNSPKNKKLAKVVRDTGDSIAHAVEDLEGNIVKPAKVIKREAKSIAEQTEEAKQRIFDVLPVLFAKVGEAIAKFVIKVRDLKQSVIDYIESEHLIDRFVDWIFNAASAVANFFTNVKNFIVSVWPAFKDFFVKAVKKIVDFTKKAIAVTKQTLKSFADIFKGTGSMFADFLSSVFQGDWKAVGDKAVAIFKTIRENFDKQQRLFAYRMYQVHDPIAEIMKFIVIAKNVIVAAITAVKNSITGLFHKTDEEGEGAATFFGKFAEKIKAFGSGISSFFSNAFAGTKETFEKMQLALLLSNWSIAGEQFSIMLTKIRENLETSYPGLAATIDKISTFVNTYGPKIKNFASVLGGFLKTAASTAWSGVKKIWSGLTETFKGTGWMFKNIFDGILEGNWDKIQKNLTYAWNNIWINFKKVARQAIAELSAKYPKFGAILKRVEEFLVITIPKIKEFASRVGNLLATIGSFTWGGLKKAFTGTGEAFSTLLSSLLSGDWATTKSASKNIASSVYKNASEGVNSALQRVAEKHPTFKRYLIYAEHFKDAVVGVFQKAAEYIKKTMPNLRESFLKGIEAIKKGLKDLGPKFSQLFSAIFHWDMKTAWGIVKDIFNYLYESITKGFKNLFTKISDFMGKHFTNIMKVFTDSKTRGNVLEKLKGIVSGLGDVIKDVAEAMGNGIKFPSAGTLNTIKTVIIDVLTIIRTVGQTLASFRAAKMFSIFGKTAKSFGTLSNTLNEVLNVKFLKKKSKIDTFVDALKTLAIIFAVVVAAVIILGNQNPAVLEQGMDAAGQIAFAIIGFAVIMKLVDKALGKDSGSSFASFGRGFLELAAGLLVMYFAIKAFGNIDTKVLEKGLTSLGFALLEIIIFSRLTSSKKGAKAMDVGKQLLQTAIAMLVLCAVIKILGKMDMGTLAQGLLAIGVILLEFGIFSQFLRSKGGNLLKVGGTLIALAAAMYILTFSIEKLGKMKMEELAKGVAAVCISLLAIGTSIHLMKNVKGSTAIAILALAAALLILVSAVETLAKMDLVQLAKGIGGVSILLIELGGMVALMSISKPTIGTAIASALLLGELLFAVYAAIQIIKEMGDEVTLEKAATLSLLIVAIGGTAVLLSNIKPSVSGAIMSAVMLIEVLGSAIAACLILNEMNDNVTLEKAEALSLVVGTMGAMAALLGASCSDFTSGKDGALLMIGMGASAIEAAIALRALDDIDNIQEKANALSTVVATMGGVATLLSWKGLSFGTGAKAAAGLVSFIGTFIAGMAILGAVKYGLDYALSFIPEGIVQLGTGGKLQKLTIDDLIDNVIPTLEKFAGAFGNMAGTFVGSFKAAELEASAGAMTSFFNDFEAPSEEKQQAVGGAVTFLSELEKNLPPKDGVFQWFFGGGTSWSTISDGLAEFGKALAKFSTYCLVVNKDSVQKGADAGKALTKTLEGLPEKPGKIQSWFEGTYEWSTISTGLADFGTALVKFSSACLLVNLSLVEKGAQAGVALATTLKELPMVPGKIASWFEGHYEWSTITTGLVEFGKALAGFSNEVKGEAVDYDSVKTAASAGLELAKTLSALPEKPGELTAWFSQNGTWKDLSTDLPDFGTALVSFSNAVKDATFNDNVRSAVDIAGTLAGVARKIPVSGGFYQLIFGGHSMKEFADGIVKLGGALLSFSMKTILINSTKAGEAVTIAEKLADIANKLPQNDGFLAWIAGFDSYTLSEFAADVKSLGGALKDFSTSVKGINTTKSNDAVTIASDLAEIANALPTDGGLMSWVFGDKYSMETFGTEIEKLGQGIKKFSDSVIGIDTTSTKLAVTVAKNMAAIVGEAQSYNAGNANDLFAFADALADAAKDIDGLKGDNLSTVANLFSQMASYDGGMVESMTDVAKKSVEALTDALNDSSLIAVGGPYDKAAKAFATHIYNALVGTGSDWEARTRLKSGFTSAAENGIKFFTDKLNALSTGSGDDYDTGCKVFADAVYDSLNNPGYTANDRLITGFEDVVPKILQSFSNAINSSDAASHYDLAMQYFTNRIISRVSGNSGTYRKDILEAFKDLAVKSAQKYRNTLFWSDTSDQYDGAAQNLEDNIVRRVSGRLGAYRTNILEAFKNLAKDSVAEFTNRFSAKQSIDRYSSSINYMTSYVCGLLVNAASTMVGTVSTTLYNGYHIVYGSARRMIQGVIDGVNSRYNEVYGVGANVSQGLINGMNALAPAVNATASAISTGITTYLRRPVAVYSPSRVTTEIGEYIDQGLINGMRNKAKEVWDSSSYVASGVTDVMDSIIQNATYAMEQDANPTITPVVDMSNVISSAGYINSMLGGTYGLGASMAAAQAARVGTMSVTAEQVTRDANYKDSLEQIRSDIRGLSEAMANMQIVMDSGVLVGQISGKMDNALGRRYMHQQRRN